MVRYEYRRYHGLGNDYIVMEEPLTELVSDPARIRRLCDRHTGLGSDGILLALPPPPGFTRAVRILNPDGGEAEKSGNGTRIYAKHCFDHGGLPADQPIRIHTLGGPVTARLLARTPTHSSISADVGRASFRCEDLPMAVSGEWIQKGIDVDGRTFTGTCVSMGNPHVVIFGEPLDENLVRTFGPGVERHPLFPRLTNVQFVRVIDRGTVEAMIWERGAGWTLSSGTSSCAVAAACVRSGLTDRVVQVRMPGGDLQVTVGSDWQIEQVGTAQELMSGAISPELVASILG